MGNQRDLNDVYWRKNYLLLLITHPRYQNRIPGVEAAHRREFLHIDEDRSAD